VCATLAAVLVLVQAGNLAQLVSGWIATSLCLHRSLLFYPDRVAARRAARKMLIFTRLGAVSLTAAQSSEAETIAVVLETLRAETSERRGRLGDNRSLEQQKREGYF